MAITRVASGKDDQASNTTSLGPIDVSAEGLQEDDILIIYARADEAGTVPDLTITGMTGMTQIVDENPTTGRDRVEAVFVKRLTASESDPSVAISTAEEHSMIWEAYRGVKKSVAVGDFIKAFNSGQNDTTPVNPAVTTDAANGALICYHGSTHDDISAAAVPATFNGITLTLGETILGGTKDHRGAIGAYSLDTGAIGNKTPTAWLHTSSPTGTAEWSVITIFLPPQTDGIETVTPDDFDFDNADQDLDGTDLKGAGDSDVFFNHVNSKDGGEIDISAAINTQSATLINLDWTQLSQPTIDSIHAMFDAEGGAPLTGYIIVENSDSDVYVSPALTVHRPKGVEVTTSTHITAGNVGTSRLTLTGTRTGGRVEETAAQNPSTTTTNVGADGNREEVLVLKRAAGGREGKKYKFRLTLAGVPLDTYTKYLEVTWEDAGATGTVNASLGLDANTELEKKVDVDNQAADGLASRSTSNKDVSTDAQGNLGLEANTVCLKAAEKDVDGELGISSRSVGIHGTSRNTQAADGLNVADTGSKSTPTDTNGSQGLNTLTTHTRTATVDLQSADGLVTRLIVTKKVSVDNQASNGLATRNTSSTSEVAAIEGIGQLGISARTTVTVNRQVDITATIGQNADNVYAHARSIDIQSTLGLSTSSTATASEGVEVVGQLGLATRDVGIPGKISNPKASVGIEGFNTVSKQLPVDVIADTGLASSVVPVANRIVNTNSKLGLDSRQTFSSGKGGQLNSSLGVTSRNTVTAAGEGLTVVLDVEVILNTVKEVEAVFAAPQEVEAVFNDQLSTDVVFGSLKEPTVQFTDVKSVTVKMS